MNWLNGNTYARILLFHPAGRRNLAGREGRVSNLAVPTVTEDSKMALKKSQLYSSLWQSCDELRGGMDASQYKDYVLTLLFMKYVSDKYAHQPDALIEVPSGGSFADMARLKGDKEIGDKINKIIGGTRRGQRSQGGHRPSRLQR